MTDALDVLLVEDNPGDRRLIRELLREGPALSERTGGADELRVTEVDRLEDALDHLAGATVDPAVAPASAGSETGTGGAEDATGADADAAEDEPGDGAADGDPTDDAGDQADTDAAEDAVGEEAAENEPGEDAADGETDAEHRSDGGLASERERTRGTSPDESSESDGGRDESGAVEATPPVEEDTGDVDVVLLDLDLPDSTGLDTLSAVVEASGTLPIVVLTGLSDREVGLQAIEEGAQDYLVKDEVTPDLLARSIHYAIERSRQERRRERRRRRLAALNRHNRIAQDVTHAVITSETRAELETAVCERLVADDAYAFAWFGEIQRGRDAVEPRVAAGEGRDYLDEIEVAVESGATAEGPTAEAVRTREVQVVTDVREDPDYEPWRDAATERGFLSSAAIPVVHEELCYGVLNVYAARPRAFSEAEVEILGRLGDVVGHAISALERREALVSDTVLELEFRVEGVAPSLAAATAEHGGRIELDSLVDADERVLGYGTASGIEPGALEAAAEDADDVEQLRTLGGEESPVDVEVETTAGRELFDVLPTHGGAVTSASIEDGAVHLVAQFPQGRDPRRLVELVEEHCPGASLQAQRTTERHERTAPERASVVRDRLTEKQWTALETAYRAGHFEWPRETSGEELADRLGVAPATLHEHLRSAERKVFEQIVEGE